jgi:hypothetical protein
LCLWWSPGAKGWRSSGRTQMRKERERERESFIRNNLERNNFFINPPQQAPLHPLV